MSVFALVEKLTPRIESELNLVINSKEEAAALTNKLKKIQVGLQEAERKRVTDKGVKDWLKELEAVAYEMDDVLDEWAAKDLQVGVQDTSLNWDKLVCSLLDSLCLCFKQAVSRREITKKMKALSKRIDTILSEKDTYILVQSENNRAREFEQEVTTSVVPKKIEFYGLNRVKKSLIEKLVSEGDDDTQIISIVGVGGIGKSTLAQVAFNDPEVDGLFAPKGWVSVSQTFDALVVGKAILGSLGGRTMDVDNLETVVQRIREVVNNKRFLLVLDNVWTEDRSKWINLRNSLEGGKGSRIVVTTRHESVAIMMGTVQWQSLDRLSDKDCGEILNGVALEARTREESEKLRGIGMEIAKKCNGLPLAARSVGSMLASRSSKLEWLAVLNDPLWKENEGKAFDLFNLLNLSYLDLPPVLQRCFLCSVVFPKGSEISIDEISRVWMAYGYLDSNGVVREVQLKGFEYLDKLTMRSFFQRVAANDEDVNRNSALYKMHDIMHDFATHLSGSDEYSFIMHGGLEKEKGSFSQRFPDYSSLGKLRTFCVSEEELRPDIIRHLTSVRVLSLMDCKLHGLPEDIGKLIHLRYLNVSENPITELPATITDLGNLQTLDIGDCVYLSSLPEGMEKLINLRHLVNFHTWKLEEFPQGLGELSDLRTLSEFRGRTLECLRNLNQLQGSLYLYVSLKVFDMGILLGKPILREKQHIEKLDLKFELGVEIFIFEAIIVEALEPPPNLQTLRVQGGSGNWLSRWITSFENLKVLEFDGFGELTDLPPFCELPALEELTLIGCMMRHLSIGFLGLDDASSSSSSKQLGLVGGFSRLKKLRFEHCHEWQEWEDIEKESVDVLTSLEELEFYNCLLLEKLPLTLLGKATSLRHVKASRSSNLYKHYNKISGSDRDDPRLPNLIWHDAEPISMQTYTSFLRFISALNL